MLFPLNMIIFVYLSQFLTWATANQVALGTSYNSVISGANSALASIQWAEAVQSDINSYLVNEDDVITASTAAPEVVTTPVTTQQPAISEPVTPELAPLPDSAVTSLLSVVTILLAAMVNIIL